MTERHSVRVGLVQLRMGDDPTDNLSRALDGVSEAISQGAEIVCLPELFRSRYFCQTEDSSHFELAEPIPGPTTKAFLSLAAESGATLVLSLFERRAPGLYHNTAAIVDGGDGTIGKYRKMHIPDDPRFYEKFYFAPGDLGYRSWKTRNGNIGVLVCWDQWFPEAARLTALQGAEILFYPTAIGWQPEDLGSVGTRQHDAWQTIQRSHAIANGCYVVVVNRTGFEPDPSSSSADKGIHFWGRSFVVGPDGGVLLELPRDEESIAVIDLPLGVIGEQRHGWPFFRDRRVDSYRGLLKRFVD